MLMLKAKQRGLSLVELMIAIALGMVLMLGVMQMFISSRVVFSTQQGMSRIQETGRLAIEFLSRDIRMAAYYGCYRPREGEGTELRNKTVAIGGLHRDFDEGIRGYDSADDIAIGKDTALGPSIELLPEANTANIVVVRSANEAGLPINKANDATKLYAYSDQSIVDNCINGICVNGAAVVNDCGAASVMKVTALAKAGTNITITHQNNWDASNVLDEYINGEIMPMNTNVYFIAKGQSGAPTLWQKTNTDNAIELLEGVEQMRITYATSDDSNYKLASAINAADWSKVNSVRLEIVVRSLENNILEDTQPYTFAGATVTPAPQDGVADRYMRQVFSTTVAIRSRATNVQ